MSKGHFNVFYFRKRTGWGRDVLTHPTNISIKLFHPFKRVKNNLNPLLYVYFIQKKCGVGSCEVKRAAENQQVWKKNAVTKGLLTSFLRGVGRVLDSVRGPPDPSPVQAPPPSHQEVATGDQWRFGRLSRENRTTSLPPQEFVVFGSSRIWISNETVYYVYF